jgi:GTP-binding protein
VFRALKAVDRADVVLLMLDASELMTAQDAHLVGYIQQATKGVVLLVNKWDLVIGATEAEVKEHIRKRLKFVSYAPLLFTSAKLGQGVGQVITAARQVYQERLKRLPHRGGVANL